MPNVLDSAQRIADVLAPQAAEPFAKWRWGDVVEVNEDGTVDVEIAGATVTVNATQGAAGASAGDRVRVSYFGTDAIADGILATEPGGGGDVVAVSYNDLANKPSIENHVLTGNSTLTQINVTTMTNAEIEAVMAAIDG